MSTDPHGILYFGFPLSGDLESDAWELRDEVEADWTYSRRPDQPESDHNTPEWDVWREQIKAWEATPENITIDWCGGDDCRSFFVQVDAFQKEVEWNKQVQIDPEEISRPQPEAEQYLREFCEKFGIEYQQPAWHLTSKYW